MARDMDTLRVSSAPKVRTPKLTYRTKSADAVSFDTAKTDCTTTTSSLQSSSSSTAYTSPFPSPGLDVPEGQRELPFQRPSFTSSDLSIQSHGVSKPPKKKSGFFASLFTVREPSAQALADYQKQLEQASPMRYRASPARVAGTSTTRLPPSVPKVNSKWDGVPYSMKPDKKRQSRGGRRSLDGRESDLARDSNNSLDLRQPRRPKSRDTLGGMSTNSSGSRNRLASLYGWDSEETSHEQLNRDGAADEPLPTSSRSGSGRHISTASTVKGEVVKSPPAQAKSRREPPTLSPPIPSPSQSLSPSLTLIDSAPVTPASHGLLTPGIRQDQPPATSNKRETGSSDDTVVIISSGPHVLGPPISRTQTIPSNESSTSGAPQTAAACARRVTEGTPDGPTPTADEKKSAQERLRLGVSLKHQAVAPWTWSEMHPESQAVSSEGSRVISPSPMEGSQQSRKKRLTIFKN